MPVKFIAEISSNHNQSLKRSLSFIDCAADIGCSGVKFQLFRLEELFAPEILRKSAEHRKRKDWELPLAFLPNLAARCRQKGLQFGCTPFYLDAVEALLPHVDFYKISSYELLWEPLLSLCAQTGKPVMLSTGMADLNEIEHAMEVLVDNGCSCLTLFHCVSGYPVPTTECNLAAITTLHNSFRNRFSSLAVSSGWSDHSVNPGVIFRAIHRWGAKIIEFHLDLDCQGKEFSGGHCWLPKQIEEVIQTVQNGLNADGAGIKLPQQCELDDRRWRTDPIDGLRPLQATRKNEKTHKKNLKGKNCSQHFGPEIERKGKYSVIDCLFCGFKHIMPIPAQKELKNIYQEKYYTTVKPDYIQHYDEDKDWWDLVYKERYQIFESILPETKRKIIDIGSGPGNFLVTGTKRGWKVKGLEASPQAISHCRELKLDVEQIFLSEKTIHRITKKYNVINFDLVLEHTPAPISLIETGLKLLAPKGLLCITVPNDFNPLQLLLQQQGFKPWWICPPHHINYFDIESLQKLIYRFGLAIKHCSTSFPMELFLLMGENYIQTPALGKKCHNMRKILEKNLYQGSDRLINSLYGNFEENGLGRNSIFLEKIFLNFLTTSVLLTQVSKLADMPILR